MTNLTVAFRSFMGMRPKATVTALSCFDVDWEQT